MKSLEDDVSGIEFLFEYLKVPGNVAGEGQGA